MVEERYVFTTAPDGYDYGSAETVEEFSCPFGSATTFRKVRISAGEKADAQRVTYLAKYQMGRYASGNHYARFEDPREKS